jgi:ubiquinone/menaquinone biosynthesis C-methylase UbiE
MARKVGPEGKVYAVDSSRECIGSVKRRIARKRMGNIEAHAASAHEPDFIETVSVDFVLAYGLLCSMAPGNRDKAVEEIKWILKPEGLAYFYAASGSMSYMTDEGWTRLLDGFQFRRGVTKRSKLRDYWAEVSLKKES